MGEPVTAYRFITLEPTDEQRNRWNGCETLACLHPEDAAAIEALPTWDEWAAAFMRASQELSRRKQEERHG